MRMKKWVGLLLAVALMLQLLVPAMAEEAAASELLSAFLSPDVAARPMFRAWMDNADYDYDLVAEEIRDMYAKGFGGLELTVIPATSETENTWGSEGWTELLKHIYRTAAELDGDFVIDITISAYWPVAVDDIDPNDEAASTELVFAFEKIADDKAVVDLPMPAIDVLGDGKDAVLPFVHTNRFEAATIARVAGVTEDGAIVLDPDSLTDVSDKIVQKEETTPAGDPDFEDPYVNGLFEAVFADENHGGYTDCVVDGWDKIYQGFWGSRALMEDTQYYYEIDLSALELDGFAPSGAEGLAEGDWVLFGFYRKGTGETHNKSFDEMSPFGIHVSNTTPEGCVVINEFNKAGADAITNYWEAHILDDELRALIKANPGDIFEDSLEVVSTTPFWTEELIEQGKDDLGYDLTPYLPLIACQKGSDVIFTAEEGLSAALWNDYITELGYLYTRDHIQRLQEWSHSSIDCGMRIQAYGNPGIDSGYAAYLLDVAEGETLGFGRGGMNRFREVAGGVHTAGKKLISDECLAVQLHEYQLSWNDYVRYINYDFAAGANRIILHGYNFAKEDPTGSMKQWPGYSTMGTFYSEPNGQRQAYWEDVATYSGYVSRMQAVLQNGTPASDLAVYDSDTFTGESPEIAALLDKGWSYEIFSPDLLVIDDVYAEDGALIAGPEAYKALIVYDEDDITQGVAEKLLALANGGVAVIFYMQTPAQLAVSNSTVGGTQEALDGVLAELKALENVYEAADDAALLEALGAIGAAPAARADHAGLYTQHRIDSDGSDVYYIFNHTDEAADIDVTLDGEGAAYLLDAWTGAIVPLAFEAGEGSVALSLNLAANEAVLVAVSANEAYPQDAPVVKTADEAAAIALDAFDLSLESWGPFPVEETTNPMVAKRTTVDFGAQPLIGWNQLEATDEQLSEMGVESMADVSGIGTYTTVFELPEDFEGGLYLDLIHNVTNGQVTRVTINGNAITDINAMTNRVDLGGFVQPGENTLEIRLVSTLVNRYAYENFHNGLNWAMTIAGFWHQFEAPETMEYGLLGVRLVPYSVD